MPHSGIKVLALLAATLAMQGIAGHSIEREAGCRPLALPRQDTHFGIDLQFFDRLKGGRNCKIPAALMRRDYQSTDRILAISARVIVFPG